jgi:putative nucleotidyltransferase with HDIG domain
MSLLAANGCFIKCKYLLHRSEIAMLSKELIKEIRLIVEEECKKDTNIFGYGIWSNHIVYVVKYSKQLAKLLGADEEIVEIAALLHDYAGIKDSSHSGEHHIYGAIEAEEILTRYDYPKEKIDMVKHCIVSHRGSVKKKRLTKEAECIASADAMAHISEVPSLLYLTYNKKGMTIEEGSKWVMEKLERSWNKLCPEAMELVKDYYESAKKVLCYKVNFNN